MSTRVSSLTSLIRKETRPDLALDYLLFLATSLVGLAVAYLIVMGQWQVAVVLVSLLPGLLLLHRYPFLAVLIWLFFMPFLLHTPTSAERQLYWIVHRALPPLTVGIMVAASMVGANRSRSPRLGLPEFAMAGYVGVSLLSIYLESNDPLSTAIRFYDRVFIPMCLYLTIRMSALGDKEMKWLIGAALFIAVSQSVIGTLSWIAPQLLPSPWIDKAGNRTVGSLDSPGAYTTTLVFTGLLLLHAASHSRPGLIPKIFQLAFLLSVYGVFLSFSRGSWTAGILALLGLIYLYPKYLIRLGLVVSVALVLLGGTLLADQLSWAGQRLYSEESTKTALGRLPVYLAAYRMFEAKPVFGWGYDNFNLYDRRFQGRVLDLVNPDKKDLSSHNVYLTLLAEQGLTGFLLFLTPLVWWLLLTLKILPGMPREGFWGRNLLIILWLAILSHVVVNSFQPALVVFDLGMWWVILGWIGNVVDAHRLPDEVGEQGRLQNVPDL